MHCVWLCAGILLVLLMIARLIGSNEKERKKLMNPEFYAIIFGGIISGIISFILSYFISDAAITFAIFITINIIVNFLWLFFSNNQKNKKQK